MALDNLLWMGNDDVPGLGRTPRALSPLHERDGQALDLLLVTFPDGHRLASAFDKTSRPVLYSSC